MGARDDSDDDNPSSILFACVCRVCGSGYCIFLQKVIGNRTLQSFDQYLCLDCLSAFHTSGYSEDDAQKRADFEELLNLKDNHQAIMSQLVLELKTRVPTARNLLEIGFGMGFLLRAAVDYGFEVQGYELNPFCVDYAESVLGVNGSNGYFEGSGQQKYDLIVVNQVFEHLDNPRTLFTQMRDSLSPFGAIYIAVPIFERLHWPYLATAGSAPASLPPDPFYDNDVHITHFSVKGLKSMGRSLGALSTEYWISEDTFQKSPGSYHGVLFRF